MAIDSSTGEISGTPTSVTPIASYTVTATNSGGSVSATIDIEVNEAPPSDITYSPDSFTLTIGTAMTSSVTPTFIGDPVTSWSISPSLPNGISFGTNNGTIWGTPTIISASTTYTVTAVNNGGSGTATITMQVNDIAPSLITYSPSSLSLAKDSQMSDLMPTAQGGAVVTWSILPALPNGLSIDSSTGTISGTPTVMSPSTSYTVTATNTGGSATATLTIVVNDAIPTGINYNPSSFTLTVGSEMTSVTPNFGGGAVDSWSISPSLPAGLSIGSSNGTIYGTPTTITALGTYTITATNLGGSGTATVTIQVNDIAPNTIIYTPSSLSLTKDSGMSPITPTVQGGDVVSWEIHPTLPTGLSIDSTTGTIGGTPAGTSPISSYTVYANNTGGSATAVLTIEILEAPPSSITYVPGSFTLTKGTPFGSSHANGTRRSGSKLVN